MDNKLKMMPMMMMVSVVVMVVSVMDLRNYDWRRCGRNNLIAVVMAMMVVVMVIERWNTA